MVGPQWRPEGFGVEKNILPMSEFEPRIVQPLIYPVNTLSPPGLQWGQVQEWLYTYLLTPCNRVLLQKLTVFKLVKKFPKFYGTRRSIISFTSVHDMSLSWSRSIQCIHPLPSSCKFHPNIILQFAFVCPKRTLNIRVPHQNSLYTSSLPTHVSCHDHLV